MTTKIEEQSTQDAEIVLLREKLNQLEEMLKADKTDTPSPSNKDEKVLLDDYIPVMSLLPYTLTLSTQSQGQGSAKTFTKFGEVKRILYKDLAEIIDTNHNFLEWGYFYIMDSRVIRWHGLDDIYSKLLTKEQLEQILETTSVDECLSLYKTANDAQKHTIIELLSEKLYNNPDSVNLNVVDRISRESGINISQNHKMDLHKVVCI